jgi:hypothetical protein
MRLADAGICVDVLEEAVELNLVSLGDVVFFLVLSCVSKARQSLFDKSIGNPNDLCSRSGLVS